MRRQEGPTWKSDEFGEFGESGESGENGKLVKIAENWEANANEKHNRAPLESRRICRIWR